MDVCVYRICLRGIIVKSKYIFIQFQPHLWECEQFNTDRSQGTESRASVLQKYIFQYLAILESKVISPKFGFEKIKGNTDIML